MKTNALCLIAVALMLSQCKPPAVLPAVSTQSSSSSAVILFPSKPKLKEPNISIEWISPTATDIVIGEIGGKVVVKVRIKSGQPIDLSQIDIYVNNAQVGNKADEVGLLKRPEFSDQILTFQVPVTQGRNAVQVVVTSDEDKRFYAERVLNKSTSGVRMEPAAVTGNTRVVWIQPDAITLGGQMFTTKSKELEIRLNITSPEPIKKENIQLLFNRQYRAPSPAGELIGSNGTYAFKDVVMLSEQADINEIGLKIFTGSGSVESERLKVNYSPYRPNLYLLSIGTQLNLKYTTKDARDFAAAFSTQGKGMNRLFNTVRVDTLLGGAAVTNEIRGAIETIKSKLRTGVITEDDVVMLFISSHGFLDDNGDLRIQGNDYAPERRISTSVSYKDDILFHLQSLKCKIILFVDACHSGGARANAADVWDALLQMKNSPKGFAIMTSSSQSEESYEDVRWQNGAFTEALIAGLKGKADNNANGIITLNELESYVKREVPNMVKTVKGKPQHPGLSRNDLGDLPLFIFK
ncbi:MAG TPA: caspase family protein [Flavilitoribacter sp.]|nr:caspase family protein [Flavilitoribacter sp.]